MAKTVKDFDQLIKEIDKDVLALKKGIAIEAQMRIIDKMPKESGAAAANVKVGVNSEDTSFDKEDTDYERRKSINDGIIKGAKQTDTINITLNAPYAEKLEMGDSEQAPQGMVRTTAEELDSIVNIASDNIPKLR